MDRMVARFYKREDAFNEHRGKRKVIHKEFILISPLQNTGL